jgi:hypothetical protein
MKLCYAPGTISLMPHVALLESGLSFFSVRVDEAGSPIATPYVKFIGSRGLCRHDPWTVRFDTKPEARLEHRLAILATDVAGYSPDGCSLPIGPHRQTTGDGIISPVKARR